MNYSFLRGGIVFALGGLKFSESIIFDHFVPGKFLRSFFLGIFGFPVGSIPIYFRTSSSNISSTFALVSSLSSSTLSLVRLVCCPIIPLIYVVYAPTVSCRSILLTSGLSLNFFSSSLFLEFYFSSDVCQN